MPLTLEDGIRICREMEQRLATIGYHCGLTGSLLYKGRSTKDADIIIYPHQKSEQRPPETILETLGVSVTIRPHNEASCTDKQIAVCDYHGTRVDLFFLK
jgi:hypothetical protein